MPAPPRLPALVLHADALRPEESLPTNRAWRMMLDAAGAQLEWIYGAQGRPELVGIPIIVVNAYGRGWPLGRLERGVIRPYPPPKHIMPKTGPPPDGWVPPAQLVATVSDWTRDSTRRIVGVPRGFYATVEAARRAIDGRTDRLMIACSAISLDNLEVTGWTILEDGVTIEEEVPRSGPIEGTRGALHQAGVRRRIAKHWGLWVDEWRARQSR